MTESAEPSERYVSAKNVETPCDRFEFIDLRNILRRKQNDSIKAENFQMSSCQIL